MKMNATPGTGFVSIVRDFPRRSLRLQDHEARELRDKLNQHYIDQTTKIDLSTIKQGDAIRGVVVGRVTKVHADRVETDHDGVIFDYQMIDHTLRLYIADTIAVNAMGTDHEIQD
jgi:hypothetical protein